MFSKEKPINFEERVKSSEGPWYCWLKFYSLGDIYVGLIDKFIFEKGELTVKLARMSKCRLFDIDSYGGKKWFSTRHYTDYFMNGFDISELDMLIAKTNPAINSETLAFKMTNGDEIIFTKNFERQKEIEGLLDAPL